MGSHLTTMHRLIYFNVEARAQASRVALRAAGIDFEDVRLAGKEFGQAKKEGKYLSGLPVLVLPDGTEVTQSNAIVVYAGKKSGLYPSDPVQALKVDEMLGLVQDVLGKAPSDPDTETKMKKRQEYAQGKLKDFMNMIEARIQGPFILGDELSVGDLQLTYCATKMLLDGQFDGIPPTYLNEWPKISTLTEAVLNHPLVKAQYEAEAAAK